MDDSPKRVVARVLTREVLATFGQIADRYGLGLIDTLVFTGVWTANSAHLTDAQLYATALDVPPDEVRRPVTLKDLSAILRMNEAMVGQRVGALIDKGMVVETAEGLTVPSAVFLRQDMLDGIELAYVRTLQMVAALEHYGVIDEVHRIRARR